MVEGLNNTEIAERLVVSRSTVKLHVSSILSRLGGSRTGAVALAVQHKLVGPSASGLRSTSGSVGPGPGLVT
jgi:DNA-binding NarL/FixJ family response regulator